MLVCRAKPRRRNILRDDLQESYIEYQTPFWSRMPPFAKQCLLRKWYKWTEELLGVEPRGGKRQRSLSGCSLARHNAMYDVSMLKRNVDWGSKEFALDHIEMDQLMLLNQLHP